MWVRKYKTQTFWQVGLGCREYYRLTVIKHFVFCSTSVVHGDRNAILEYNFFDPSVVPMRAVLRSSLLLLVA